MSNNFLESQLDQLTTILKETKELDEFIYWDFYIYGEEVKDAETLTKYLNMLNRVNSYRESYKTIYIKAKNFLLSNIEIENATEEWITKLDTICDEINCSFNSLEIKLLTKYKGQNISQINCLQNDGPIFYITAKVKMIPEELLNNIIEESNNFKPMITELTDSNEDYRFELKTHSKISDLSEKVGLFHSLISTLLNRLLENEETRSFVYSNFSDIILTKLHNTNSSFSCIPTESAREWQEDALNVFLGTSKKNLDQKGKYHLICEVATGAGKTRFALMCIKETLKKNPNTKIRVIVPKIILMHQWAEEIKKFLNILPDEIRYMGGSMCSAKKRKDNNVAFSIYVYKTAIKEFPTDLYNSLVEEEKSNFLIADECHHYYSPENIKIFKGLHTYDRDPDKKIGYYSLALSATPHSYNYKDMELLDFFNIGSLEDITRENIMYQLLGPTKYKYTLVHAVADGVVSPLNLINVDCKLNEIEMKKYIKLQQQLVISLSAFEDSLKDYFISGNSLPGKYSEIKSLLTFALTLSRSENKIAKEINAFFSESTEQDNSLDFGTWLNSKDPLYKVIYRALSVSYIDTAIKKHVNNCESRILKCIDLAKEHSNDKVIIFAETIKAIEFIYENLVDYLGKEKVLMYHSKMSIEKVLNSSVIVKDKELNKEAFLTKYLEPFKNGSVNILCTAKVFDEGVDIPNANVGIIFQGTESERQNIQRAGRIIRKSMSDRNKVANLYWFFNSECNQETFLFDYLNEIEDSIKEEEYSGKPLSENAKKSRKGLDLIKESTIIVRSLPPKISKITKNLQ